MSSDDYKYPNSIKSLDVVQAQRTPAAAPVVEATNAPESAKPQAAAAEGKTLSDIERKLVEGKVIAAIRTVYDPEIPVNIHDLGLIYEIDVRPDASVKVKMTLTAPGCPVAGSLPLEVQRKIQGVDEVRDAEVVLVWDPPWDKSRMSEEAQLMLGF
jgi:FeS assembly SUF system protein